MEMEHYEKGSVSELPDDSGLTFHPSVVHMKVSYGSKIRNLMGYAMKRIKEPETRQLTWNGYGSAITKTISCAEIMKRKVKGLHQITKIRFKRTEEVWEPKMEGLERLKVNQDTPSITILLSLDPLDENEPGYQAPGNIDPFWKMSINQENEQKKSAGHKASQGKHRKQGPSNSSLNPPNMEKKRKKRKNDKDNSNSDQYSPRSYTDKKKLTNTSKQDKSIETHTSKQDDSMDT